jgi:cytochrome c oxidase subunit 2
MNKRNVLAVIALVLIIAGLAYGIKALGERNGVDRPSQNAKGVSSGPVKELSVIAKQWSFEPSEITVDRGDTVKLRVKSVDVPHGIVIKEYGINERLERDDEVTIEFVADKSGEFAFYCNVFCGKDHQDMVGKLVVR